MGALATWLGSIIASLASMVGLSLAKKTIFATAAIAASIALTVALAVLVQSFLAGIVSSLPGWAAVGAGFFIPSNASPCIAALIAAKFGRFVYDWNMSNLHLIAKFN